VENDLRAAGELLFAERGLANRGVAPLAGPVDPPPSLLLVHSPFLGPATWQPVARCLVNSGRSVRVPNLVAVARSEAPYWPAGVRAIVTSAELDQVVLVAHSNGGLYVPPVARALGDRVRGVVYVDAALPGRGHSTTPEFLNRLATPDGLLPPWTTWWDKSEVAALFPDADVQAIVEAEQPSMPLAYYDFLPPAPADWRAPPSGYLWFGKPYDQAAAEARRRGWPTMHLPGKHLHMLVAPNSVATAVLDIARAWR